MEEDASGEGDELGDAGMGKEEVSWISEAGGR